MEHRGLMEMSRERVCRARGVSSVTQAARVSVSVRGLGSLLGLWES